MSSAIVRQAITLGTLPKDYEYKLFWINDELKVIGANPDKEPICYIVKDNKLIKQEFKPEWMKKQPA